MVANVIVPVGSWPGYFVCWKSNDLTSLAVVLKWALKLNLETSRNSLNYPKNCWKLLSPTFQDGVIFFENGKDRIALTTKGLRPLSTDRIQGPGFHILYLHAHHCIRMDTGLDGERKILLHENPNDLSLRLDLFLEFFDEPEESTVSYWLPPIVRDYDTKGYFDSATTVLPTSWPRSGGLRYCSDRICAFDARIG